MVTVDPGVRARAADLEPLSPRAVAATLEQIDVVPAGVCAYLTCGDDDARAFAGRLPRSANRPRALIVNRREASILTGASSPEEAAAQLGTVADTAVVTLGPAGAVAVVDGRPVTIAGVDTSPVLDTTGAGDLFAAAFLWGDLLGVDAEVALGWANLYAGLSVCAHTGTGGAVTRERLDRGGRAARDAAARGGGMIRCAAFSPCCSCWRCSPAAGRPAATRPTTPRRRRSRRRARARSTSRRPAT